MKRLFTLLLCLPALVFWGQSNFVLTTPGVEDILRGDYNPAEFTATQIIDNPQEIVAQVQELVSPDSLKSYLFALSSFHTRNTGSDTVSATTGIGAARRWVYRRFQEFSEQSQGRLIPFYFQFDQNICGMGRHRNVCAVLPGRDTSERSFIVIEGHLDSRCESVCDVECKAHGMEDNGSGTALVIELARVLSRFTFDHTIVFMATIGEEQGLFGANAFATYAQQNDLEIKAVLNNDIVGGIICGETSSPPSCPGLNHIDSTQVRLFSAGGLPKQLARFVKLEYQEELEPLVPVPMMLTIMSAEDRQGRGGDHIPFRQRGYPAMRFTSANEHGNANTSDPNYHDRQHTSGDVLGVDTDGDSVIDSFFVDFNYLARNTVINGMAATLAALGPITPTFDGVRVGDSILIRIHDPHQYLHYRIFTRTNGNDFDDIFTLQGDTVFKVERVVGVPFRISVASVDSNGVESLFSEEDFIFPPTATSEPDPVPERPVELYQNRPNPFDEATVISYFVHKPLAAAQGRIVVTDLEGRVVKEIPAPLKEGLNEVLYFHGYNATGTFVYSLLVDGQVLDSKTMVFAN